MIPFNLRYQCKTSGLIVLAKRTIDRAYLVLRPGEDQAKRYHGPKLRKEYQFLGDVRPKVGLKINHSRNATVADEVVSGFVFHKGITIKGERWFFVDFNGEHWGSFNSKTEAMEKVREATESKSGCNKQ